MIADGTATTPYLILEIQMMIKAGSITELLDKISKLAEEPTKPSPELDVDEVKDPLDTLIRAKVASLVVENCEFDSTADLKEALETVYDFVTA